ncbi:alpha/beta fold hydrolase [uncultured Flavobacterium sp.]|uniref:alpha/beta hydrolase n=1 Tax=uncultured Flavobacterium sp. TaxID=165435 RepID=UPI0025ED1CBC|nr:alpha/beta fold hydrolase [uncultured Flavobacterium sp.]
MSSQSQIKKIENFKSEYVQPRNVEVWLPDAYFNNSEQQFPVLYMHDGQNVFNPKTASYHVAWEADSIAQQLINESKIKPVIIVASWCTDKRFHEYFPEKATQYLSEKDNQHIENARAHMGTAPSDYLADEYLNFITKELKPYIDKNYRTLSDKNNTSICGSSMGGLISLYAICEYPEVFGQAACVSTHWSVLFNNDVMSPSEAIRQYLKDNLPSPTNHRIYFDYGTETLDQYYEPHQKKVNTIMTKKGYTLNDNWVTKKFEGASHNEQSWQERFDIILQFLFAK